MLTGELPSIEAELTRPDEKSHEKDEITTVADVLSMAIRAPERKKEEHLNKEELQTVVKEILGQVHPVIEALEKKGISWGFTQSMALGLEGILTRRPTDADIVIAEKDADAVGELFDIEIKPQPHDVFDSKALGTYSLEVNPKDPNYDSEHPNVEVDFIVGYAIKAPGGKIVLAEIDAEGNALGKTPKMKIENVKGVRILENGSVIEKDLDIPYIPPSRELLVKYQMLMKQTPA